MHRRAVLVGALALGACAQVFPPLVYDVQTTDAARQQMLSAVRAFGAREGLRFEDRTAALGLLPFYTYLLHGPRTTLIFSSDIHRPGVNVHFKASFEFADGAMIWTGGDDQQTLANKFAATMASIPGVRIERVAAAGQEPAQP